MFKAEVERENEASYHRAETSFGMQFPRLPKKLGGRKDQWAHVLRDIAIYRFARAGMSPAEICNKLRTVYESIWPTGRQPDSIVRNAVNKTFRRLGVSRKTAE